MQCSDLWRVHGAPLHPFSSYPSCKTEDKDHLTKKIAKVQSKTQHVPQSIDTAGGQQAKLPPGEESFQGTENLTAPSKISCVAEQEDCGSALSSPRAIQNPTNRPTQPTTQRTLASATQ